MRPEFGNKEHIAANKSRLKQAKLPIKVRSKSFAFKFKPCVECMKRLPTGNYNISHVVGRSCGGCREAILKIANKEFIIGGGVRIVH
jgi:hypothetical protein